jgi:type II secretory pathway component GspD/PulD (secretin)
MAAMTRPLRRKPTRGSRRRHPPACALLFLAFLASACRGPKEATPEPPFEDQRLTTEEIRKLIAHGALRPVDPLVATPPSDARPGSGDTFAETERRFAEQEAARNASGAATKDVAAAADMPSPGEAPQAPAAKEPPPEPPAAPAATARPANAAPPENPYLLFGKRIVVYANGLIMKPYPLRVGTGEKLQKLLESYGNFPLYKEGQQTVDQVRLELLKDWDQEQFADLRQTVVADEQTKSLKVADWLIVTSGMDRLKEVEDFINVFAAGVPQIEIEAKIVEVTTADTLDLGIRPIDLSTPIFGFPDHTFVQSLTYTLPNSASTANSLLGLSAVQDGVSFNAILQALQTYDNVSIVSQPKIAVREGGIARIVNTNKLPSYSVSQVNANGQAAANLIYEEIGIKLYVVPRVVGTQTVALNIDIEASQQSGTATTFTLGNDQVISNPIISRRAAQTVVYLEPGQAVILGGLVTERTVDTENKVPILGSIPVIGYFFKSTFKRKEQSNVLFFIRPRILTGSDLNREF